LIFFAYGVASLRTVLFNTLCNPVLPPARPDEEEVVFPVFAIPLPSPVDSNSFLLVGISMNGVTD
jgi:hypothetical protein